jgi:hypothetical protein
LVLLLKEADFSSILWWCSSTKGISQIWLQLREKSKQSFRNKFSGDFGTSFSTKPSNCQEAAIAGSRVVHGSPNSPSSNWWPWADYYHGITNQNENWGDLFSSMKSTQLLHFHPRSNGVTTESLGEQESVGTLCRLVGWEWNKGGRLLCCNLWPST